MIIKKITIYLFLLCILNGCVQNAAFLGPIYTLASTGNVYHASLSYGSEHAIKKITGKSSAENIKSLIDNSILKDDDDNKEEHKYDEFIALVKNNIEKKSKILNLANQ